MKRFKYLLLLLVVALMSMTDSTAQCTYGGSYVTDNDEIPCGDAQFPCCQIWSACNGPGFGCANYDPDYSADGGCDMSCTPIDSGVLFLLIGGGLFGGFMIKRRRETELMPLAAK